MAAERVVEVPEGVTVSMEGTTAVIKGEKGELKRDFRHPRITLVLEGNTFKATTDSSYKKDTAILGTWAAHIRNMITGVTEGYTAEMKVVFMHFPMTMKLEGDTVLVNNFIGEKGQRRAKIVGDTKVDLKKEDVIITGIDKEAVGQTAANIERLSKKKGKDIRVFQDGIYITKKPGKN